MKRFYTVAVCAFLCLAAAPGRAGLDLQNQAEIHIPALDLDGNGRVTREEAAEYLFYYFDHDGNESLSSGEYSRRRPLSVPEYDPAALESVDLDGDGQDDGLTYDTETFLQAVFVGEYEPDPEGVKAHELMDLGFLRMDVDKSKYIEISEWSKHYKKFTAKKENLAPKAADNDRYRR